jgi:pimeloyl-ACP methyl ester carboxylesterase
MVAVEHVDVGGSPCPERSLGADRRGLRPSLLRVGGVSICAYMERNDDHPVVFLHGNSSTKSVWTQQFAVARQYGRSIIAPDLPGHGDSDDSPAAELTYSFPGYAAVVSGLLDRLNTDVADIVGWSLGGHIGLQLFATDARIRSLMIVGTPPARPSAAALEQAFHASNDMQLAGKCDFSQDDAIAYGTAMMGGRNVLSQELLRSIKRTDGNARKYMFANALRGIGIDQRAAVESIDKPLCVAHGEHEPFVRLDYLRSLRYRALWKNRIFIIAGAGHAPHWEKPAAFNRVLSGFLGSLKARRGMVERPDLAVANSHKAAR